MKRLHQLPRRTTIVVVTTIGLLICFSTAASFLLNRDDRPAPQPKTHIGATKVEQPNSEKPRTQNEIAVPTPSASEAQQSGDPIVEATEPDLGHFEQHTRFDLDEDPSGAEVVADFDEPLVGDTVDESEGDDADDFDDEVLGDSAGGSKRHTNRDRVRRIREADKLVTEGHRYWRRGRLGMAESSYLQALEVYPKYPRALVGMVRVHLQRRASGEALRSAKMLVRRKPQPSLYRLLLGDAYALDGDLASARAEWRIASRRGNRTARSRLRAKND